ncbi:MAG: hypothetical protein ACJAS1_006501 [Oleiphilaceae bacterium]|jgi:hypothetical protein
MFYKFIDIACFEVAKSFWPLVYSISNVGIPSSEVKTNTDKTAAIILDYFGGSPRHSYK